MSMHTQQTDLLLKTAELFLSHRDFTECRRYALQAQESDPTHPVPAQLMTIATVLSAPYIAANVPDYYSVLSLPCFTSDHGRIMSSFLTRFFQFDPIINSHPCSSEALDMVLKARQVLLNDNERARFDEELRKSQGFTSGVGGTTFWTMCPYCYHVYEYDTVFQDCCLRCQNVKCRKGFHGVAIAVPPPPEVVEKGQYLCGGFVPLMFIKDKNCNDGLNSEKIWVPFGETMVPGSGKDEVEPNGESDSENNEDGSLHISSDDEIEIISPEAFENYKKAKFQKNVKAEFQKNVKIQGDTMGCTGGNSCANGEKETSGAEKHNGNMENSKKEKGMKIKFGARSSKKLMGRGLKVDIEEAFKMMDDVEEEESDGES